MKLDKQIEPLPADSTLLVRPRSARRPQVHRADARRQGGPDLEAGSTIPVRQARTPVELDEFFGMFDDKARVGSRNSLDGYGGGLAGRGQDLNTAIEAFVPLVDGRSSRCCATCRTRRRGSRRFFRSLADTATEVAPVAEQQASLFVNLDISFTALASVARPVHPGDDQREPAHARSSRSATSRRSARSCATTRRSSRSSGPAWRRCRTRRRSWPTPSRPAPSVLPKTIPTNEDLADVFNTLADFSEDPLRARRHPAAHAAGVLAAARRCTSSRRPRRPATTRPSGSATPPACSPTATPTAPGSASSRVGAAPTRLARQPLVYGPNNEGVPSSAPANGPSAENHLHFNPYPNTAAPGQTQGVRGRQRALPRRRQDHDRQPAGNQGTKTDGQVRDEARGPGEPHLAPFQAGLIALVVILIGDLPRFTKDIPFTKPYELKATFENAPPIQKNQAVRIAGVDVGKVSKVEPVGGDSPAVVVTMKLKDDALPIHKDATDQGAAAHLLRGQPLLRHPARARPSARDAATTATRSRPPRPRRRCSSTRCSARSRPNTRKDLQKLLDGLRRRAERQAAAGRGRRPGSRRQGQDRRPGAERVARLLARGAARRAPSSTRRCSAPTCTTSRSWSPGSRRCSPRSARTRGRSRT